MFITTRKKKKKTELSADCSLQMAPGEGTLLVILGYGNSAVATEWGDTPIDHALPPNPKC